MTRIRQTRHGKWHQLYYLLAIFDVLTVAGGLYLTHQIVTVFSDSVSQNNEWVTRLDRFSTLGNLSSGVVAPGNDVFLDLNPDEQERRLQVAVVEFDRLRDLARADTLQVLPDPARAVAVADFGNLTRAEGEIVGQARLIFEHIRLREPGLAGREAARMNRHYQELRRDLNKLREDARQVQRALLEANHQQAQLLRLYQVPLGIGILCMVGAATIYGHKMSKEMQAAAHEREGYISQLQESEVSLERRIEERTAELRQNERRLATSEERFQLAARATNDVIWDYDVANGTIWRSRGFKSAFGHGEAPTTWSASRELIHPDDVDRVSSELDQVLKSSSALWTSEYRLLRRDGRHVWVLDRGFVIRDDEGRAQRMIGSMMDITDRKEAERMKSDFVSFVSHQLRTPLSGMSWMLELADDAEGLPAEAHEYIADARESANRLVSLVNELLDIARLESGRTGAVPAAVSLEELTRSVLKEFQGLVAAKQHQIEVAATPVEEAWADPQFARQVVANLLSNAVKYTPTGGHIAISLQQHNGSVQWSIKDNGLGIPKPAQSRLFEKFYRADNVLTMEAEGTGLGLHLVRLIVQQAGGRIWCESEEGEGALFAFTLPIARTEEHTS